MTYNSSQKNLRKKLLLLLLGLILGSCVTFGVNLLLAGSDELKLNLEEPPVETRLPVIIDSTSPLPSDLSKSYSQLLETFEMSSAFHRRTNQLKLISAMDEELLNALIHQIDSLVSQVTRPKLIALMRVLVEQSARNDPIATMATIRLMKTQHQEIALSALFHEWIQTNLPQARNYVSNMDKLLRSKLQTKLDLSVAERSAIEQRLNFDDLAITNFLRVIETDPNYGYADVWTEILRLIAARSIGCKPQASLTRR